MWKASLKNKQTNKTAINNAFEIHVIHQDWSYVCTNEEAGNNSFRAYTVLSTYRGPIYEVG